MYDKQSHDGYDLLIYCEAPAHQGSRPPYRSGFKIFNDIAKKQDVGLIMIDNNYRFFN